MGHQRIMQKQWSLDEVRLLRELARQKLPLIVIARKPLTEADRDHGPKGSGFTGSVISATTQTRFPSSRRPNTGISQRSAFRN